MLLATGFVCRATLVQQPVTFKMDSLTGMNQPPSLAASIMIQEGCTASHTACMPPPSAMMAISHPAWLHVFDIVRPLGTKACVTR